MTKKYLTIPAVVAGALGLTAVAQAAEPTTAELQQQIAQLQNKIQQMDQGTKNAATSRDVDATVESVLKDANDRSKLLAVEGMTAGHNGENFVLQSADGNYKLMPKVLWQFRYVNNWITDNAKNGDGEMQDGFENRRLKLSFEGNAISPDLKYVFRWSSNTEGATGIDLAYITYKFADDLAFRVGQYKEQVHHEEIMSDGKQLAVERSLTNAVLGGGQTDYTQGVALLWDNHENMRGEVNFTDGFNSDNTNFQNAGGSSVTGITPTDFGVTGRFEWAINGGFKGYDQFSSMGRKEDALVLGAGFDFSQASSNNILFHTVDVQWNSGPIAVYGAYLGMYRDFNDATDDSFYDYGIMGQVGYMLNDQWEAFGRAGYLDFDTSLAGSDQSSFWEVTGGVNYYLKGHNAKVTVDLTWLPEGSPASFPGYGVLAADGEDEFVLRGQFQLML